MSRESNPFKSDLRYRLELAYRMTPKSTSSLLDFGFGDGSFLIQIRRKIPCAKLYGFEIDNKKVQFLKQQLPDAEIFNSLDKDNRLPLKDESIDIVCLLDVLEHVPDESAVLSEIYRVLKPGGRLLLSVPHKGLTEIFDPGNIKFRAPKLHKFFYKRIFKYDDYEKKYGDVCLFGDISVQKKMWHKHYSISDLKALLKSRYKIEKIYYYGFFFPLLVMINQALICVSGKEISFIRKLILSDSRRNYGQFSFSIFINTLKV